MRKKVLIISIFLVVSLFSLVSLSIYSFQKFNSYIRYASAVDHHHLLLSELTKLRIDLTAIENNQRSYLLFNDTTFYEAYSQYPDSIKNTFKSINNFIKGDTEQQKRLHQLNFLIKSRIEYLKSGIITGYPPTDFQKEKIVMQKCLMLIGEMEMAENKLLNDELLRKEFYENNTPQNFRMIFVLAMSIFAVSFGLLFQQYRKRLIYQEKLEMNILEINQANAEWEQISHVVSHDLQEPLRKIRTFSDMLQSRHFESLNKDGKLLAQRIDTATKRAQFLLQDIVNYNLIVNINEKLHAVNLNETLNNLRKELENNLKARQAVVHINSLPLIEAYPSQMTLLFRCLIENSLKFSKADEIVKISITANTISKKELPVNQKLSFTHYHKIIIEDNGIGFENQFAEKIFEMFQRLHTQDSDYEGRGIGLSMVRRIMTNHKGLVAARGRPAKGSVFTLYFPAH